MAGRLLISDANILIDMNTGGLLRSMFRLDVTFTDGRVLAVEYKGQHLYDGVDAEEKRAVGAVWASRSGGQCLFVMPTGGDFLSIMKVLTGKS